MSVIMNAVIESVEINDADRGMLTAWLHLSYGGTAQGFGGYALYLPKSYKHHAKISYAGHFIWRCMEIAGVTSWDDVAGKTIRVEKEDKWGSIIRIGHIVKDDWFDPKKEMEA
jgi:hypothetical protein